VTQTIRCFSGVFPVATRAIRDIGASYHRIPPSKGSRHLYFFFPHLKDRVTFISSFKQVGVSVAGRTTPPPKLDKATQADFIKKAQTLAPKYRTELLKPANLPDGTLGDARADG
jgi:hypothetical protein